MRGFHFLTLALGVAAGSLALTACGGDDDESGSTNDDLNMTNGASNGATTGGDAGATTGGSTAGGNGGEMVMAPEDCPADTPIFDGEKLTCMTQEEGVMQCKEQAAMQSPGPTDDPSCGAGCTCQECTQEMIDCGTDPEGYCPTIVQCANENGCTSVACYTPENCQEIIDNAPGGGLSSISVALATAISDCVDAAGCAPSCM